MALAIALLAKPSSVHAQQFTFSDQKSYYGAAMMPKIRETPQPGGLEYQDDLSSLFDLPNDPQFAPIDYIGSVGAVGSYEDNDSGSLSIFRLIEDVDDDGIAGAAFVVTIGPDGNPFVSTFTDFDDLHTFNIAFNQVKTEQRSGLRSFDVAGVYWVYEESADSATSDKRAAQQTVIRVGRHKSFAEGKRGTSGRPIVVATPARSRMVPDYTRFAANRRGGGFGLVYGYRELGIWDWFKFEADGGILGHTFSDTETENWVTGPQAGVVAFKQFGPLTFYAHGLLLAGLNDGDMQQSNGIGAELVPGATNRLLYAQPTRTNHAATYDTLAPTGSLWAEAGLQITPSTSLKFAWSATYIDNILLAADRVRYYLPDMGFRDPGNQHLLVQNFYCGIEFLH